MAYTSFEDLNVWKRSCQLAVDLCRAVRDWREFWLKDQLQRAAVSVPSNIAEGAERDSKLDYIRFLRIAKGSAAELRTQCYIATRLGLLDADRSSHFTGECIQIGRMLQGLIKSLRAKAGPPSRT